MENSEKSQLGETSIPRLLNAHEVAAILNVSKSYAYALMQSGEIPIIHLGKARRVKSQDLIDFIEKNTHSREDCM